MRDFVKTNEIPMNDDAFYEAIADKFNNLNPDYGNNEYQKGLVDGIAGAIGVILSECDPEMKKRVLEKLQLKQIFSLTPN